MGCWNCLLAGSVRVIFTHSIPQLPTRSFTFIPGSPWKNWIQSHTFFYQILTLNQPRSSWPHGSWHTRYDRIAGYHVELVLFLGQRKHPKVANDIITATSLVAWRIRLKVWVLCFKVFYSIKIDMAFSTEFPKRPEKDASLEPSDWCIMYLVAICQTLSPWNLGFSKGKDSWNHWFWGAMSGYVGFREGKSSREMYKQFIINLVFSAGPSDLWSFAAFPCHFEEPLHIPTSLTSNIRYIRPGWKKITSPSLQAHFPETKGSHFPSLPFGGA